MRLEHVTDLFLFFVRASIKQKSNLGPLHPEHHGYVQVAESVDPGLARVIYSEALTLTNNIEHFIIDTFTRLGSDGIERPVEQPDQVYIMHLKFNSIANIDKDRRGRHLRFVIQTAGTTSPLVPH